MDTITYRDNWNGKLICDTFPDVRLPFPKYALNSILEVEHERIGFLGYAKVMSVVKFKYGQITDNMSYSVCGKPRAYLRKMLADFYEGMNEEKELVHIILAFTERNAETLPKLLELQYNKLLSITPRAKAYADGPHSM